MPFKSVYSDPLDWTDKGELTKVFQDVHAFSDSLDLCKFSAFAMGMDEYVAQYAAFCGIEFTVEDGLIAGERIYNLERYYNNLAGYGEGSDYLPYKFTQEPSTMPGSEGQVCELEYMLADYYRLRGWENGVVPEAKLRELEIVAMTSVQKLGFFGKPSFYRKRRCPLRRAAPCFWECAVPCARRGPPQAGLGC